MEIIINTEDAEENFSMARMLEGTGKPIGVLFGMYIYCDDKCTKGEAYLFDKGVAYIL